MSPKSIKTVSKKSPMKVIANNFKLCSKAISAEIYGAGHINITYLIVCEDGTKYIMQKINNRTFSNIDELMSNICGVTEYIAKSANEGDEVLLVVPTLDDKPYYFNGNEYYRVYTFLSGETVETGATLKQFELAGRGFGQFQNLLNGYPADKLFDSIKNFHNTVDRFSKFEAAVESDIKGRAKDCREEIEFFISRKGYCSRVLDLISSGEIPLRVTHNDTKPNNVLVDEVNDRVIGVLDLDTIMSGSILYDFGDSIRYGANTGAEDEVDLTKIRFSEEYYESYCKGFLPLVKHMLTDGEKSNMHFGAMLMTYECGMRFLTDYLSGDTYFRIHREHHNLDRCRTQIKLLSEMEKKEQIMVDIAKRYL